MILDNQTVLARSKAIEPWIIDIRRKLHQCPELLYELHETSEIVSEVLHSLSIEHEKGIADTGILATIGSGKAPCVMLRADMDALPITELADIDYKSRYPGRMHACGHDCHMAMLLGAAKILKQHESSLGGTVKLCFQPAEEGGAGARQMCDEGIMQNPDVDRVFGLHVWPMLPTGMLTGKPGPFLAATHQFTIRIIGNGGHAAMPHFSTDPLTTAAKITLEAQTIISREQDPLTPGVLSITAINGGSAYNVIPETTELKGTIRSLSENNRDQIRSRLEEIAQAIAAANRCRIEIETWGIDYPETSNDPQLWEEVYELGESLVGRGNFPLCSPMMGGEDFAFYGAHAPTCFVALGTRNESTGCTFGLHHPRFKVDESALHLGTALHVRFATESVCPQS